LTGLKAPTNQILGALTVTLTLKIENQSCDDMLAYGTMGCITIPSPHLIPKSSAGLEILSGQTLI